MSFLWCNLQGRKCPSCSCLWAPMLFCDYYLAKPIIGSRTPGAPLRRRKRPTVTVSVPSKVSMLRLATARKRRKAAKWVETDEEDRREIVFTAAGEKIVVVEQMNGLRPAAWRVEPDTVGLDKMRLRCGQRRAPLGYWSRKPSEPAPSASASPSTKRLIVNGTSSLVMVPKNKSLEGLQLGLNWQI